MKARFPAIKGPDIRDICYATQNRQNAVRTLAEISDVILVVGAENSSNSNRLRDLGAELSVPSYLIDDASMLEPAWLERANTIGITAGASAPEELVMGLVDRIGELGTIQVETLDGPQENIAFKLPDGLRDPS